MNYTPKISVVMSVYNGSNFLAQSILAILDQTFQDFEFIIIDDASTDDTPDIIKIFADKDSRIRPFRNEKNIGPAGFIKNLNFGCRQAKGKYIARIDHDDISRKDRFQLQYDFLENNPEVFIIGAALRRVDENGNDLGEMRPPLDDENIRKVMPKKISLYHPVIMFRKEFYEDFYREKMRYCEDYDFYLRIMTDSLKMANLNECLLEYRILQNSLSREQDKVIKNLFIHQSKVFYKERLEKGRDSYGNFDPNEFLNIYENHSKPLIQKAIDVSKKYFDFRGFEKLMKMYKESHHPDFFYAKNSILLTLGESVFYKNSKFINKLS
ncbi:MAG: glycosyl transferase family 2 [Chryseobacterium sp.]|nr:MAG: glycosyl transferase family 2 [Chryseobacterium sp.]